MAMTNLTSSGAVVCAGKCSEVLIQVNAALTGTITVLDGTKAVAVITNPTVGSQYAYWNFQNSVSVNPNGNCDITVNVGGSRAGH